MRKKNIFEEFDDDFHSDHPELNKKLKPLGIRYAYDPKTKKVRD